MPKQTNVPARRKHQPAKYKNRKTSVQAKRTRRAFLRGARKPKTNGKKSVVIQGDAATLSTEDKKQAALELRIEGHSEYDIGIALGLTQGRISQMLKEVLQEKTDAIMELSENLRSLELERLDRLILAWYNAALHDTRSLDGLMRIIERRHKILPGLEITRSEMSGVNGTPIRLSASSIDITKLGTHPDGDRLLANLEEIIMIAGPRVTLPKEELPAIEHKRKMKNVN